MRSCLLSTVSLQQQQQDTQLPEEKMAALQKQLTGQSVSTLQQLLSMARREGGHQGQA
jgi:hypothetical protein